VVHAEGVKELRKRPSPKPIDRRKSTASGKTADGQTPRIFNALEHSVIGQQRSHDDQPIEMVQDEIGNASNDSTSPLELSRARRSSDPASLDQPEELDWTRRSSVRPDQLTVEQSLSDVIKFFLENS